MYNIMNMFLILLATNKNFLRLLLNLRMICQRRIQMIDCLDASNYFLKHKSYTLGNEVNVQIKIFFGGITN